MDNKFKDGLYIVESVTLNAVWETMQRLYKADVKALDADETRTMANRLYAVMTGSYRPETYEP